MDPMNLETKYSEDCSEVEETGPSASPSIMCLPSTKPPTTLAITAAVDYSRCVAVSNAPRVVYKSGAKLSFWSENESPAKRHDDCGKTMTKEMIEESLDYSRDSVHQVRVKSAANVPTNMVYS